MKRTDTRKYTITNDADVTVDKCKANPKFKGTAEVKAENDDPNNPTPDDDPTPDPTPACDSGLKECGTKCCKKCNSSGDDCKTGSFYSSSISSMMLALMVLYVFVLKL